MKKHRDDREAMFEAARKWLDDNCPQRLIKQYDACRLVDFALEQRQSLWHKIESEGLPEADGEYVWRERGSHRNVFLKFNLSQFTSYPVGVKARIEYQNDYARKFVAYLSIPPFTDDQTATPLDGDANE